MQASLAGFSGLSVRIEALPLADWVAISRAGLPPIAVGRFLILAEEARAPANRIALTVEAGLAFGTGHHASTRLCLRAFEAELRRHGPPKSVLDLGTGTGILAMAAARAGARRVLASDIDPEAVRVARANARANRARVRVHLAHGERHPVIGKAARYDLLFANILSGPLVRLAPRAAPLIAKGGLAILSGLLAGQTREVLAPWRAMGLRLRRRLAEGAWRCLVMEKVGPFPRSSL
ncbi:MAG: 50S ribosomal protein L11 methyltransferase [Caulobacteraceae bacterium]